MEDLSCFLGIVSLVVIRRRDVLREKVIFVIRVLVGVLLFWVVELGFRFIIVD